LEGREKELRSQFGEKMEERNSEIAKLRKELQEESAKCNQFRVEALRTRQEL
jgi:hypothetical protein